MFLTLNLFAVEGKAACSFIEPSTDLIPLHASDKKESDLSKPSTDKNKNYLICKSHLHQYLYHVIQKKYYTSISRNFFFSKALCEDGSLKFQNFPFVT